MKPIIDHIQITVKNMKIAEPFYDKLMPILGYSLTDKISAVIEEHDLYVVEYLNESFDFAICSPRTTFKSDTIHRRKPGAFHHMAFRANSRKEVDELYLRIKQMDDEGKELSLGLLSQVAQHRGNNDGNE